MGFCGQTLGQTQALVGFRAQGLVAFCSGVGEILFLGPGLGHGVNSAPGCSFFDPFTLKCSPLLNLLSANMHNAEYCFC